MNDQRFEERRKFDDPDYEGVERRRVQRIRGILVGFRKFGSQGEFQGVFLRDMSLKGVSFTTTESLVVGDKIEMNIYLTDTKNPAVVLGEVRWVEKSQYLPVGDKPHLDMGIEIVQISEEALNALKNYMRAHEGDQ